MKDPLEKPWHGIGTGGCTALDFANTLDWRLRERPVELLKSFPDLLRFARSAGVIAPAEARRLRHWAESHRRSAERALARAAEIREAIAGVFQAVVDGASPPPGPLARLGVAFRAASEARVIRTAGRSARWVWSAPSPEPDRPMWAAALDAVRVLTTVDWALVGQCGDAECGWFFLDTSRNRSRRWCSMKGCGNRNKARRFYTRSVAKAAAKER